MTRAQPVRRKGIAARRYAPRAQVVSRAEEKIRENERFLQAVFDGIQDGISVLDSDLNVVRVNHAMENWYEHNLPLAGKKCYTAYHLRSLPCEVCPVLAALSTGRPQMEEVPLTGPEGVRGRLELHAFPLYDGQGRISGAIEYIRDITLRKEAEAAKRESDERLKSVMDNIPGAIFWKDRNLVYLGCNRQFAEDGGLASPDEIVGKTALDMPWAGHADFYHSDDREVMESDTPKLNIEEPLTRADGTQRWLRTNKIPMHDASGQVIGLVTTYEDITPRKQMEQYMLQSERLAAMGRLAAALAHEVNNPLHAIGNALELVLDFPLEPSEQQKYLRAALLEIERLQALARRVLGFARPPQLERQLLDVSGIIEHALAVAGRQLRHNNIVVDVRLPGDLPRIAGSRDHLTQVFLNLIINAAEAMPNGGLLRISARADRERVELSFADTGGGIPARSLAMIFEPFYTTKEDGTGLGLAVSHSIIREHGGDITARNTAEGALFILMLPAPGSARESADESQTCEPVE